MKTLVTQERACYETGKPKYYKQVFLYPRMWAGSAFAFDTAIDLTASVSEVGTIQIKLDTEAYNKWTYSNCTITLRNDQQQWLPGYPGGYFPSGRYIFNSKVVIIAGVVQTDGTKDPQYIYTGYITEEPTYYPDGRTVQILIVDHMSVFAKFNAEETGIVVTDEQAGSNGGTVFTTANCAVGIIGKVKKGLTLGTADELDQGTDYSVSNLNEHDGAAAVTLNTALVSGQSLWVTYTRWYTDKTIEWIVARLCAKCGVTNASISPAVFSNSIKSAFSQGSDGEFASGIYSGTIWGQNYAGQTEVAKVSAVALDIVLGYPWTGRYNASGEYLGPVIDGTTSLKAWGQFNASYDTPTSGNTGGTTSCSFFWRESDDGSGWTDWSAITPGSAMPATKRYIQLKWCAATSSTWYYSYSNIEPDVTPRLYGWSVDYYYTTTTIPVVNMTGLTCEAALQQLAEMVAYEIGFDSTDTFIFRPRTSSSSAVDTLSNANIAGVESVTSGFSKLYTRVKVSFGDYAATVDADTEAESHPNNMDIFGVVEYSLSGGNFLPASTVNLAQSIALTIYQYVKDIRRRVRAKTKFYLHLELGDKVTLKLVDENFMVPWRWGDGRVRFGQKNRAFYYNDEWLKARQPLYQVAFRVEGLELDLTAWATTFDLTEAI